MTLIEERDGVAKDERGRWWVRQADGTWERGKPKVVRAVPAARRRRKEMKYISPERMKIEARRPPRAPLSDWVPEPYVPGERAAARAELRRLISEARFEQTKGKSGARHRDLEKRLINLEITDEEV